MRQRTPLQRTLDKNQREYGEYAEERREKKCRNNKTVSMAGSQAECEGRVQIKRRIEELEVSQSDFTVFFTPPSFPLFTVSAKIFCQKVMETPL